MNASNICSFSSSLELILKEKIDLWSQTLGKNAYQREVGCLLTQSEASQQEFIQIFSQSVAFIRLRATILQLRLPFRVYLSYLSVRPKRQAFVQLQNEMPGGILE